MSPISPVKRAKRLHEVTGTFHWSLWLIPIHDIARFVPRVAKRLTISRAYYAAADFKMR